MMRDTFELDADAFELRWRDRSMPVSPLQFRAIEILSAGTRVPSPVLAAALGCSVTTLNAIMTNLRNFAARRGLPLGLSWQRSGYALAADMRLINRVAGWPDELSARIILALIRSCSDPMIAELARRHFSL